MKSKFLKCLSTGITAAVLAASIIPISASTAFAAATKDFNNYYNIYILPHDDGTAAAAGQDKTYYAIFQIASLESYDEGTGFAEYTLNNSGLWRDLWTQDNNKNDLFSVDDQGRIMYSEGSGWKLFDESDFESEDLTLGTQTANHNLINIIDRAADKVRSKENIESLTYKGKVQGGNRYDDGSGAEVSNPSAWGSDPIPMYKLGNDSQVQLTNGLYLMISIGPKLQTPNLISVAEYNNNPQTKQLYDKGSNITIDKEITSVTNGGTKSTNGETAEVAVGSKVKFTLTSVTPMYDQAVTDAIQDGTAADFGIPDDYKDTGDDGIINYVIYDDPSVGLDINFTDGDPTLGLEIDIGDTSKAESGTTWTPINKSNAEGGKFAGFNSLDQILRVEKIAFNAGTFAANYKALNQVSDHKQHIHGGNGFKIVFTDKFITTQANMNKAIRVTFTATVNDQADTSLVKGKPNTDKMGSTTGGVRGYHIPNEGIVQYDNQFLAEKRSVSTYGDTVHLYRVEIAVNKINGEKPTTTVEDAQFEIRDDDGSDVIVPAKTIDSKGYITFNELPAGTYTLRETYAPEGYKKIDDIKFTITPAHESSVSTNPYSGNYTLSAEGTSFEVGKFSDDDDVYGTVVRNALNIENYKGQTLPGTGGMGTVIFTVVGAGIIVLAGVLFVVYMKKRRVEEK